MLNLGEFHLIIIIIITTINTDIDVFPPVLVVGVADERELDVVPREGRRGWTHARRAWWVLRSRPRPRLTPLPRIELKIPDEDVDALLPPPPPIVTLRARTEVEVESTVGEQ